MLVGLDGAGKSTLLQAILGEPFEKTMPTFGFNNASTSRDGFDVDLFDLGGGKRIRGIWKAYTADVHGCVFVVDAANEARFSESREVFAETLRDPHLSGKPVLVCANKQDLPGAKTVAEVAEALGLATLQNDRHRVVPCVAAREDARAEPDASVDVGMRWMMERVGEDWDELNPRVVAEAEAYRKKEEALKRERLERGKEARRERLEASRKRASRNQAKGSSRFGDTSEEEDGDEDEEDARAWAGPVQAERPPQFSTGSGGETVEAKGLGKARVGQFRGASIARLRAIEQYRAKRGTTDFSLPGAPVAESGSQVHTFA